MYTSWADDPMCKPCVPPNSGPYDLREEVARDRRTRGIGRRKLDSIVFRHKSRAGRIRGPVDTYEGCREYLAKSRTRKVGGNSTARNSGEGSTATSRC